MTLSLGSLLKKAREEVGWLLLKPGIGQNDVGTFCLVLPTKIWNCQLVPSYV